MTTDPAFPSLLAIEDFEGRLAELKKGREDFKAELTAAVSAGHLPAEDAALLWNKRRIRVASGLKRLARDVERCIRCEAKDALSFKEN